MRRIGDAPIHQAAPAGAETPNRRLTPSPNAPVSEAAFHSTARPTGLSTEAVAMSKKKTAPVVVAAEAPIGGRSVIDRELSINDHLQRARASLLLIVGAAIASEANSTGIETDTMLDAIGTAARDAADELNAVLDDAPPEYLGWRPSDEDGGQR